MSLDVAAAGAAEDLRAPRVGTALPRWQHPGQGTSSLYPCGELPSRLDALRSSFHRQFAEEDSGVGLRHEPTFLEAGEWEPPS